MEASEALSGAPGGAGAGAEAGPAGYPEEPPQWLSDLSQSFGNQLAALGERVGRLEPGEGGDGDGSYGPAFEDGGGYGDDGYGDPDEFGPYDEDDDGRLGEALAGGPSDAEDPDSVFADMFDAEPLDPRLVEANERMDALEEGLLTDAFDRLTEQYPELQDERVAEALAEEAQAAALAVGEPGLVEGPGSAFFAELVYLAGKGAERADGERPVEAGPEVALEGGGGTPADGEPDNLFQQIHAAQRRGSPNKPFKWG
jgi:hypothetical protein